jgi:hypothetical protein
MPEGAPRPAQAAIRTNLGAIFVSLEVSRRAWLITSLSPGGGEKMSKQSVPAGEVSGLLRRFAELRCKAVARTGRDFPIIVIQEAGLDGFWIQVANRNGRWPQQPTAVYVQLADLRRNSQEQKRCAETGPSRPRPRTGGSSQCRPLSDPGGPSASRRISSAVRVVADSAMGPLDAAP